ncbi:hypothetical protein Sjap_010679 [Stephania japonica]|uniref:Uncharacterized protein n=1 Tax=Stephania japonica TaxID=461633 RepID=A0AAP0P3X0_9MAGN
MVKQTQTISKATDPVDYVKVKEKAKAADVAHDRPKKQKVLKGMRKPKLEKGSPTDLEKAVLNGVEIDLAYIIVSHIYKATRKANKGLSYANRLCALFDDVGLTPLPRKRKVSRATAGLGTGKNVRKGKIGNGAVKNVGKESTALTNSSSEEENEEGNEEDDHIGRGLMDTSNEEGGNEGQLSIGEKNPSQGGEGSDQSHNESNGNEGQLAIGGKTPAQYGEGSDQLHNESNVNIIVCNEAVGYDTLNDAFIPCTFFSSLKNNEGEGPSTKESGTQSMDKPEPQDHVMEQTQEEFHKKHDLEDQHRELEEQLEVMLQKNFEVGGTSKVTTIPPQLELSTGTLQHQQEVNEKMKVMDKQLEELKLLIKSSNSVIVQQQQMEEIRNVVHLAVQS